MFPERQLRRRLQLPPWVVPFNPDDEDMVLGPPLRPAQPQQGETQVQRSVPPTSIEPTINLDSPDPRDLQIDPHEMLRMRRNAPLYLDERDKPKSGFSNRLIAGLKTMGRLAPAVMAQGGLGQGLGAAISSFALGVADPETPLKIRRELSLQKDEADLERDQDWRNKESVIGARDAEAQERLRPQLPRLLAPHYEWLPDPNNPDAQDVYAQPTLGMVRPVRKKLLSEPAGFNLPPGGAHYDASGKLIVERPATPKESKEDTSAFTNTQLQQAISDAKKERDGIWKTLKDNNIQPTTTIPSNFSNVPDRIGPNPIYDQYIQRGRQLDDDIRKWTTQMKPGQASSSDPLRGAQWHKSWYRGSKPIEQAAREAEARGAIIVD